MILISRYGQPRATVAIICESFAPLPNVVVYRFGDFILRDNESLWIGDSLVPLSPLQLRLLTFLCAHPQQIHAKERIAAEVWGRPEVSDVSLARAIHGLRSRLVAGGKPSELIRNIYGRGYILTQPVRVADAFDPRASSDGAAEHREPPALRHTEPPFSGFRGRLDSSPSAPPRRVSLSAIR